MSIRRGRMIILRLLAEPWAPIAITVILVILAIPRAYLIPQGIHLFLAAEEDLLNELRRRNVVGRDRRIGSDRRQHSSPVTDDRRAGPDRRKSTYCSRFALVRES
jgi:hypothetical protein